MESPEKSPNTRVRLEIALNNPLIRSNELCTGVRPTLEDETGPRLFRPTQARGSRLMTGQFLYRRHWKPSPAWPSNASEGPGTGLVIRENDPPARKDNASIAYYNRFAYEFWCFVFVQQEVAKAARTLIEFLRCRRVPASICRR